MRLRLTLGMASLALALAGCAASGQIPTVAVGTATSTTAATTATATAAPSTPETGGGTTFTAFGGSTPWRAVVDGDTMTTEGAGVGEHRIPITRSAWATGMEFTGIDQGRSFSLVIEAGRCQDVDGTDTGQVAELTVGNRKLRGCAVSGVVPHADDA